MKIIHRYIGTTICGTMLLALLILMGLEVLITFIAELNDIGVGDYHLLKALEFVLLDMPRHVYMLFPMAALIGVLMGLGLLASHSELIVMRASGLSIGQISVAVIQVALLIIVLVTLVGETIAPEFKYLAETRKAIAMSGGAALKTKQGVWLRDEQNFMHIKSILPGERLQEVTRYEFDNEHRLLSVSFAKSAFYQQSHWVLQDVQQSKINANNTVTAQYLRRLNLQINLNPHLLRISQIEPEQMNLWQLKSYINYRKHNGLRASNYSLAFWQRIIQPLATVLMVLLAIPFIFGPLRSSTMGLRFVAGIIVGFTFYILNQFFGPMSLVYQFQPFLAAVLPTLLMAGLALVFLLLAW